MSSSKVNKAAAPRQVPCKTLDNDHILVDLDVLLLSHTFKKMYDDLGLQEQDDFPGVFPVMTVSSRVFNKVIQWCKEHKGEPEPVIEKDPLTQECKWFTFSEYDYSRDIPRFYHYACQSVAAGIKRKSPREICALLRQECDLDDAQTRQALDDNPWLECPGRFPSTPAENAIFIPNEVLVIIFAKLPREDLERLRIVSTQFDGVIVNSVELSEQQGPLRVVTGLEFGASLT